MASINIYGRKIKAISDNFIRKKFQNPFSQSEVLGEALSIFFNVADQEKQQKIISNTPVTAYGISCIYPQIPGIPPYHNNAVWPFVESYWALASAKVGNEEAVVRAISSVYRPAALFLSNNNFKYRNAVLNIEMDGY